MSVIAAALKHMMDAGLSQERILAAVADMEAKLLKDESAERRRKADRERKAKARQSVCGNPQTSADSADIADTPSPLASPPKDPTPQNTPPIIPPPPSTEGARATVVQLRPQVAPPPPAAKLVRASRLPADFTLTAARLNFALKEGLTDEQAQREFAQFCDHWLQSAGPTAVKRDWDAAWRNWVRKAAAGFGQPRGNGSGGGGRPDDSRIAAYARAGARAAAKDHVSRDGADIFSRGFG